MHRSALAIATTFLAVLTAALVFAVSALAATSITVTFVRHAESQANADGVIDTKVPGPHLSDPVGLAQAQAIRDALAGNGYDGIYASDMIRTQETAQPLANLLGKSITVLPGLHEIDAGVYEGSSQNEGWDRLGYALTPLLWTLGLRFATMPGSTDSDGNVFQHRVADAVQDIYDSGNQNPVVFSHGATIMFWTLMNVDNPDLFLLFTHPLNNTSVVVINGNPEDGWKLVNWDGVSVDAEPSLLMKMFVDLRDLIVAPQEAAYAVSHAFDSGNLFEAADALIKAAIKLGLSPIDFVISVAKNLIDEIFKPATPSGASTAAVEAAPEPAARLAVASEPVTAEAAPPTATSTPEVTPSAGTQLAAVSETTEAQPEPSTEVATPEAAEPSEPTVPATTEVTKDEAEDQTADPATDETTDPATEGAQEEDGSDADESAKVVDQSEQDVKTNDDAPKADDSAKTDAPKASDSAVSADHTQDAAA